MFLSLGASTSPPCSQHPLLLFQAFPPGPALPLKNTTRTGQDPPSSCLDTFIDTTKPCWFSLDQADNSAFCICISSWLLWANTQSQAISLTASWDIKWNSLPLKLECSHLFWKPSRYLWDTILLAIWASIWWIIFDIVLSLNIPMFWIQFSWMFPANVQIITSYPHTKLLCSLTPFWPVQLFFFFLVNWKSDQYFFIYLQKTATKNISPFLCDNMSAFTETLPELLPVFITRAFHGLFPYSSFLVSNKMLTPFLEGPWHQPSLVIH